MPSVPEHLVDYRPRSVIGHGKFSTVIKAYDKLNSNYVAIKIITKSDTITKINKILPISSSSTNYDNEIKIIETISSYQHPNIVTYLNIFESISSIYIIQELSAFGELNPSNFKYPVNNLSNQSIETVILSRLLDMLSSIQFLHSLDIIHRDIKPSNFLIFTNGIVKLTDFDTCYTLTNDPIEDKHQLYSKLIGTPLFLPPELLTHQKPEENNQSTSKFNNFSKKLKIFDTKSKSLGYNPYMLDLWSLGVTLHYLFYSIYPFYADNEFTLLHKIATVEPNTPEISELSFHIDSAFPIIKLINYLLIKSPFKRWTINQILKELNVSSSALLTKSSKSPKSSKSSKSITLHKSKSMDLSISDLSDPQDEEEEEEEGEGEDDILTSAFTKLTPGTTDKLTHQRVKFQLPIFMSPKDVISSQWRDSTISNSKSKTKLPNSEQLLSSTSLPIPPITPRSRSKSKLILDTNQNLKQGQIQEDSQYGDPNNYANIMNNLELLDRKAINDFTNPMSIISNHANSNLKSQSTQSSPIDFLLPPPSRSLLDNPQNANQNRLSVHTLPELQSHTNHNGGNSIIGSSLKSKNGSVRSVGLKHSELINFKKFRDNVSKQDINNSNSDNVDDVELGNNYRLYTMDDYLDKF